jgi:hypothetical protein
VSNTNTWSEIPEHHQPVRVEEGAKLDPPTLKVTTPGHIVELDNDEEGEIEWKRPDLKGWDPKPDLVLY